MPQSLAQVWLHLVFSTKDRQPFLQHEGFREEMFRMLSHHVQEAGCFPKRCGGWIDHVHIVCGLSRTVTIAALVEHVKTETSKWAKQATNGVPTFAWQAGYGVFSVSQSNLDRVIRYVNEQKQHHQTATYQDEFRALCQSIKSRLTSATPGIERVFRPIGVDHPNQSRPPAQRATNSNSQGQRPWNAATYEPQAPTGRRFDSPHPCSPNCATPGTASPD